MPSWTPVPLAGFDDEEDAQTVLMSRSHVAWDEAHESDLTAPATGAMRDDVELGAFEVDPSMDEPAPPAPPAVAAERVLTPWQMALAVGMALPVAVAAAAYLLI